jgi:ribosomal protein L37AE/L43A
MPARQLPLFSVAMYSHLQQQAVALMVCPRCHSKTLIDRITNDLGRWLQCTKCNDIYLVDP